MHCSPTFVDTVLYFNLSEKWSTVYENETFKESTVLVWVFFGQIIDKVLPSCNIYNFVYLSCLSTTGHDIRLHWEEKKIWQSGGVCVIYSGLVKREWLSYV